MAHGPLMAQEETGSFPVEHRSTPTCLKCTEKFVVVKKLGVITQVDTVMSMQKKKKNKMRERERDAWITNPENIYD